MADPKKQPGIKIDQILLEEVQFSHCEDWLTRQFTPDALPELALTLGAKFGRAPDGSGAILGIQVSTVNDEANPPRYNFRVSVTAVVSVDGDPNIAPDEYVLSTGGSLLYPFLREIVANLTMRGRFGPIWLKPFNMRLGIQQILEAARASAPAE